MPFAHINAATLYYEQHGAGDEVVFLHGAGGNHLSWFQQVPAFSARYRVTLYDTRGWGLSRGEPAGRFVFGTDLIALLDHLAIERAHVVAQSMGGRAVAGLARLAAGRIRSLVLCGTTAGATNDRIRSLQDELAATRGNRSLREHALAPGFEEAHPELATLYRQIAALNPPRQRGLLGRPPATYRGSMHEALAATGAPILFVVGEHDLITSPAMIREAHRLIPGSEMAEFDGAGHSAYFEQPARFNTTVLRFLERT